METSSKPIQRTAKLVIVLGFNGTGKTTVLRHILQSTAQKALVITPDDAEWTDCPLTELEKPSDFVFRGIHRHIYNPDRTLDAIAKLRKGALVFDDCRAYFQDRTDTEIRKLLIRRRQLESDVYVVGHGFTQVPPVFFTFVSHYILFRTVDNIERRKDCIYNNFEYIKQMQAKVNAEAKSNPHYFVIINNERI